MKDIMTEYEDRVAEAQRNILLELLIERCHEPVGDVLAALDEDARDLFLATPLDQLFEVHLNSGVISKPPEPSPAPRRKKKPPKNGARKPKNKKKAKRKSKAKAKTEARGTKKKAATKRTTPKAANEAPAGVPTELIDAKILQAIRDNPDAKKDAILLKTGFSDSQFRTSTHRLISAGKIHRSGKTRGATYKAA